MLKARDGLASAMAMTIRHARDSDNADLRRAFIELQEVERSLHDSRVPGAEVADRYLASLWHHARHDGGAIFVAEESGLFRGFLACLVAQDERIIETPDSNRCGYVSDICVVSEARGQGIAQLLLAAAEAHLATRGVVRLRLGALAGNTAAQSAYRRYGFAPYEIVLEKRIG